MKLRYFRETKTEKRNSLAPNYEYFFTVCCLQQCVKWCWCEVKWSERFEKFWEWRFNLDSLLSSRLIRMITHLSLSKKNCELPSISFSRTLNLLCLQSDIEDNLCRNFAVSFYVVRFLVFSYLWWLLMRFRDSIRKYAK